MRRFCLYFIGICLLYPGLTQADITQTPSTQKNPAALPDLPANPPLPQHNIYGITVTSYIAGSYNYLSTSDLFTSEVPNRL